MKVRFKKNSDLDSRICYEVKSDTPCMVFSNITNQIEEMIEVSVLGLVPSRLLEEARENDVDAIDVLCALK